jgi:hypothetical protein
MLPIRPNTLIMAVSRGQKQAHLKQIQQQVLSI